MNEVKDRLVEELEGEGGKSPTLPYIGSMNVPISEKEEQEDE